MKWVIFCYSFFSTITRAKCSYSFFRCNLRSPITVWPVQYVSGRPSQLCHARHARHRGSTKVEEPSRVKAIGGWNIVDGRSSMSRFAKESNHRYIVQQEINSVTLLSRWPITLRVVGSSPANGIFAVELKTYLQPKVVWRPAVVALLLAYTHGLPSISYRLERRRRAETGRDPSAPNTRIPGLNKTHWVHKFWEI